MVGASFAAAKAIESFRATGGALQDLSTGTTVRTAGASLTVQVGDFASAATTTAAGRRLHAALGLQEGAPLLHAVRPLPVDESDLPSWDESAGRMLADASAAPAEPQPATMTLFEPMMAVPASIVPEICRAIVEGHSSVQASVNGQSFSIETRGASAGGCSALLAGTPLAGGVQIR